MAEWLFLYILILFLYLKVVRALFLNVLYYVKVMRFKIEKKQSIQVCPLLSAGDIISMFAFFLSDRKNLIILCRYRLSFKIKISLLICASVKI